MATSVLEILIKIREEGFAVIDKVTQKVSKSISIWSLLGKALGGVVKSIRTVLKAFFSLKSFILIYGVYRLVKSFFDAASAAEQFQIRLQVLLGSISEGNRLFNEMAKLAVRVPKTFREIMEAASQLARVMKGGTDEIAKWMPLVVDLSAATGLSLQRTTDQIVRMYAAGAAAAILFRRRGITQMLGFQYGVSYSAEQTRKQLMKVWEDPISNFRGAAQRLARTWEGLMSMFADQWFLFRTDVMKAGVFDYIKAILQSILGDIYKLRDEGKIKEWAEGISKVLTDTIKYIIIGLGHVADSVKWIWNAAIEIFSLWATYKLWVSQAVQNVKTFFRGLREAKAEIKYIVAQGKKGFGLIGEDEMRNQLAAYVLTKLRLQAKNKEDQAALDALATSFLEMEVMREKLKLEGDMSAKAEKYAKDTLPAMVANQEKSAKAEEAKADAVRAQMQWLSGIEAREGDEEGAEAAPMTRAGIAKGELAQFKMYVAFRETILKTGLDNELVELADYEQQRLALNKELYKKERTAIEVELKELNEYQIKTRKELEARLRGIIHEELEAEIQILEEGQRIRERKIDENLQNEMITREQWRDQLIDLEERTANNRTKVIEKAMDASWKIQEIGEDAHLKELVAIREEAEKDMRDLVAAYQEGKLKLINTTLEKEATAIADRYQEEKRQAEKNFYDMLQREIENRSILDAMLIKAEEALQKAIQAIKNKYQQKAAKDAEREARERERAARAKYDIQVIMGGVDARLAAAREVVHAEWQVRLEEMKKMYGALIDEEKVQNAERRAIALAEAAEWANIVKETLAPLESGFGGLGTAFDDLGSILQYFYEVAGNQSKDFARTVKAVAIAAGIVQSLQAGISALLAGMEFGKTIGNPAIGLAMGSMFMGLAIAAGMAKVAMMQATHAAHGGLIDQFDKTRRKFPRGGVVPGNSPTTTADNIPARLTAGEFVHPVSSVRYYGTSIMEAIRRRAIPRDILGAYGGMRPHVAGSMFAAGGSVQAAQHAAQQGEGRQERLEFTNVNIIDPYLFDQYMTSPRGDKTFVNLLTKNEDLIRRMARR